MEADDAALRAYYERGIERERLSDGRGDLEFTWTTEIVLRRLPAAPAVVADIGGGPGRYALWLASLGYQVEHRDLMPLHVEQLASALLRERPARAPETDAEQEGRDDLRDEGLGARDADLGAGVRQDGRFALAHDRRADDVADRDRPRAELARQTQRGQRVGRFARL